MFFPELAPRFAGGELLSDLTVGDPGELLCEPEECEPGLRVPAPSKAKSLLPRCLPLAGDDKSMGLFSSKMAGDNTKSLLTDNTLGILGILGRSSISGWETGVCGVCGVCGHTDGDPWFGDLDDDVRGELQGESRVDDVGLLLLHSLAFCSFSSSSSSLIFWMKTFLGAWWM